MAQKNATPTKEQAAVLERNGLDRYSWVVVKDLAASMIVKSRVTGDYKLISK